MKAAAKNTNNVKLEPREDGNPNLFASCSFEDLGLHSPLCNQLRDRLGFKVPTTIQAKAIPVVISGRHVLVNAPTGTGKTIAYLAPIIHQLQLYSSRIKRSDGTFALVLVPTRELCLQVHEILESLLHRFHWIVPGYIMGGENRSKEKARLRKGISILVATPGRLLDHLNNTTAFLYSNLRWIIFDEADRILELGFGKDIEAIIKILRSRESRFDHKENEAPEIPTWFARQNLLLSATLNEKVNQLAKISLHDPVMIGLGQRPNQSANTSHSSNDSSPVKHLPIHEDNSPSCTEADYKLPDQLVQRYVKVSCGSRLAVLLSILRSLYDMEASQKVVIFFSTRAGVDFHYSLFEKFGWPSDSEEVKRKGVFLSSKLFKLHGDMDQKDRRTAFQGFNTENSAVLLCTDVAARGLDFPKVRHIIQYDSPGDAIEYVHRVGRTARIGEKGNALLFLIEVELAYLQELGRHGVLLDEFPLQKVLNSLGAVAGSRKKHISLDMHPWILCLQKALETFIHREPKMKQLAKDAFLSWVRAYTAHRGVLKEIFMVRKLHLGHAARSFGLREQPSAVGGSFQKQLKKRKRDNRKTGASKKRKVMKKP